VTAARGTVLVVTNRAGGLARIRLIGWAECQGRRGRCVGRGPSDPTSRATCPFGERTVRLARRLGPHRPNEGVSQRPV
jgi:hypothetical protein